MDLPVTFTVMTSPGLGRAMRIFSMMFTLLGAALLLGYSFLTGSPAESRFATRSRSCRTTTAALAVLSGSVHVSVTSKTSLT